MLVGTTRFVSGVVFVNMPPIGVFSIFVGASVTAICNDEDVMVIGLDLTSEKSEFADLFDKEGAKALPPFCRRNAVAQTATVK